MANDRLLTLPELAELLGITEDKIKKLVKAGRIPYYKIGGTFLRFKYSHLEQIKSELNCLYKETDSSEQIKGTSPISAHSSVSRNISFKDRLRDFWHFYDFYVIAVILAGIIIFVIFKTIN